MSPLLPVLLDVAEREMYSYIASYFCLSIFLAYNNHLTRYIYSTINAHYHRILLTRLIIWPVMS